MRAMLNEGRYDTRIVAQIGYQRALDARDFREVTTMLKIVERISASYLAYVMLLLGFVSLGVFVASLATGSDLAGLAGVGLLACLAGAIAGFRVAARQISQAKEAGDIDYRASIFATPLHRTQLAQYLDRYRSGSESGSETGRLTVLAKSDLPERKGSCANGPKLAAARDAVPDRLSA